ncbi:MAG: helix-turn-helix transcriptional regulator [Clostridiales bacterium]|nr:helix-turn-helix transcriptional regulator [Clostridiales bacterium]MDD7309242.1 helix-turn-helix transcriptional regulator [Eubacteriales bacterium]MDY5346300.1 helix-turn-helix transcriptional regulator [Eubacteriales bacterium]
MIQIVYHNGTEAAGCQPGQTNGFENAEGNGEVHCYQLFDGVYAMLMRLEMESYTETRTQKGMLEINFCVGGRFETCFSTRDHAVLKPGDMAISSYDGLHGTRSESYFPLGYYEGICLEIVPETAQRWVERNAPAFLMDVPAFRQNLLGTKWYMCSPAGSRCEHVFRELYESASYMDLSFLRLKVLELLMLLTRIPRENGADSYCSAKQAELIRHLRDHLLTDREGYVSLAQLAADHEISVSHMQKLFKQIYGVPIYHYIREYRLEQAAMELVRGTKSVTQIAQDAGYDNASKFSECFKKRYGTTPSQYRLRASMQRKR